jgi:ABC-2 type transport system permease protein
MKPYLSLLSMRFRSQIQYRLAAIAGVLTQVAWGFIRIMVLAAFYRSSTGSVPMSFSDTVTYVWLGQAMLGLLPWGVDYDARDHIRTGTVAYELARPISFYPHWFVRALGWRTGAMALRAIPLVFFAAVLMPILGMDEWALRVPDQPAVLAAFGLSLVIAALISAAITTILNLMLFLTVTSSPTGFILPTVFSGMVIPLPLFPDSWQLLIRVLPFRFIMDVPGRIFSSHIPLNQIPWELALGVGWFFALVALGAGFASWAVGHVVVQGG